MDNETIFKERFDAAVGGVSPDVVGLVAGGVSAGRGLRRGRRIKSGMAAVALSALGVGLVTTAGQITDVFGSHPSPTSSNTSQRQVVASTPRSLAAAVMRHVEGGTLVSAQGLLPATSQAVATAPGASPKSVPAKVNGISVLLTYRFGKQKISLEVMATTRHTRVDAADCSGSLLGSCEITVQGSSTSRPVSKAGSGDGGAEKKSLRPSSSATEVRPGQRVVAIETSLNGGPDAKLPIDDDTLMAIVSDPDVGASTTPALVAVGATISPFISGEITGLGGLILPDSGFFLPNEPQVTKGSITGHATRVPPATQR